MPVKAASVDETNSTPPTISIEQLFGTTDEATLTTAENEINNALAVAFDSLVDDANVLLAKYNDQEKIARGCANANAYASRAATHQGYQDYSIFAITSGAMIGVQLPSMDPDYYTNIDKVQDEVEEEGDLYTGIGLGVSYINAGIHGGFLNPYLWDFYFNISFGYLRIDGDSLSDELSDSNATSTLLGMGVSYSLINTRKILQGVVTWRGISFSTGLYYNNTQIDFKIEMEPPLYEEISYEFSPAQTITANAILDPSFTLDIDVETYTIPLEVNTSVKVLSVLNFNLGAGVDFNFGSSKIEIGAAGETTTDITNDPDITGTVNPGTLTICGETRTIDPSLISGRIMTGIGFNILPVKIDIPVTLYFDSGFAVGLTVGLVW